MSDAYIGLVIAGMALINIAIRWPVYLLADHLRFPPLIERALAFVPVAVLTAIIVPAMLYPRSDAIELGWDNPYLVAGILAALAGWRFGNLLATILVGMSAFFLLRWWMGA
jgi:branched-subunit amino acid transport protein